MNTTCRAGVGVALLLGALCGCGNPQESAVTEASTRFYRAVAAHDGAAACDVLAPRTKTELEKSAGKPCAQAILEEHLPAAANPRSVQAFGTMAMVGFEDETAFLSRFQGGWKVIAAGCRPQPKQPYDCQIQGG